jgi:hypothetical protein
MSLDANLQHFEGRYPPDRKKAQPNFRRLTGNIMHGFSDYETQGFLDWSNSDKNALSGESSLKKRIW